MTHSTRIFLSVGAGLAWLAAMGGDWLTLHQATVNLESLSFNGGSMAPGNVNLDWGGGLLAPADLAIHPTNGTLTLAGFELDLWLIVALGGIGSLLAGLRATGKASLPRLVPIALLAVASLYVAAAWALNSDPQASLGPGLIAGSVGAALGWLLAALPDGPSGREAALRADAAAS